jgi:hypothetical protein
MTMLCVPSSSSYTIDSTTYLHGCFFGSGTGGVHDHTVGVGDGVRQQWKLQVLCATPKSTAQKFVCIRPLDVPGAELSGLGYHAYLDVAGMQTGFFPEGIMAERSPRYDVRECRTLAQSAYNYLIAVARLHQSGNWLSTEYTDLIGSENGWSVCFHNCIDFVDAALAGAGDNKQVKNYFENRLGLLCDGR